MLQVDPLSIPTFAPVTGYLTDAYHAFLMFLAMYLAHWANDLRKEAEK